MRVGIGYDVHRFDAKRKLKLGGIEIPGSPGLAGHSDADVLLHAIADALLGAMGEPDLGTLFPDTDPQYRGADSRALLEKVQERLVQQGYKIVNVDTVIVAETPKLAEHKPAIVASIQRLLRLQDRQVNVKAKTAEGLDAIGQKKAIAVHAVVLIDAP